VSVRKHEREPEAAADEQTDEEPHIEEVPPVSRRETARPPENLDQDV
jgi:hypothetical protein